MQNEKLDIVDAAQARAALGGQANETLHALGRYHFELVRRGQVIDAWDQDNLVTTQGRNHILDTELGGSAYTAAWFLSLYTAGSAGAASTYAVPVVTEVVVGVLAARPSVTFTAASAGTKTSNVIVCTFVGSATMTGAMLMRGVSTIADTGTAGGIMLSQSALSPTRAVVSGDVLNVTYSLTV